MSNSLLGIVHMVIYHITIVHILYVSSYIYIAGITYIHLWAIGTRKKLG
jgi:hypothetical protein